MKKIKFLPLVAFSVLCLLLLKSAAMLFGANQLTGSGDVQAQAVSADQKAGGADKDAGQQKAEKARTSPDKTPVRKTVSKTGAASKTPTGNMYGPRQGVAEGEMALLQSLVRRRQKIDAMRADLALRETLLKAAEKKIEARLGELKAVEARIKATFKREKDIKSAQFTRLVKLYSGMKPKDAARIFDKLDMKVLVSLVQRMKPRVVAPIMASMSVARAQLLTRQMAAQSGEMTKSAGQGDLPAIKSEGAG